MIDETVIDTRKKDKNVVIISEERYGEMEKAERNSVYLRKLDRGLTQVRAGHGVVKSMTELEAMEQILITSAFAIIRIMPGFHYSPPVIP